jgi:hypothetical protein
MMQSLSSVSFPTTPESIVSTITVNLSTTTYHPPSHVLAVYSPASGASSKVKLYPAHSLILQANCSNLPLLPASEADAAKGSSTDVPVVPLRLPSAETFPILLQYLYTKNTDTLIHTLLHSNASASPNTLRDCAIATGIWRNAVALGVVDRPLYQALDRAWKTLLQRLQNTS